MGLDIGGDDYITKPFKLAVFLSRGSMPCFAGAKTSPDRAGTQPNGIKVRCSSRGRSLRTGYPWI